MLTKPAEPHWMFSARVW